MSKTISTIISLTDRFSPKLFKINENLGKTTREAKLASKTLNNMATGFTRGIDSAIAKTVKWGAATTALVGGMAVKTSLAESMDLEGYRTQIETATKDTKKTGEIMRWANKYANITPFETGEVVSASAKLESMGMSAQKVLPKIADMAGATNKSMDQATEAFIDAQTGELERMKEFGVTKVQIAKKANEMFKNQEVINNKGQIVDQQKFNETLEAIMVQRFKGGAEKMGQTMRGMWSTITGITKSGLAKLAGMTEEGTIRAGSPLDKLKPKIKALADKFQELQDNGTLDKWSDGISNNMQWIIDKSKELKKFIDNNKTAIETFGVVFISTYAAIKTILLADSLVKGIKGFALIIEGLPLLTLGSAAIVIGVFAAIAVAGFFLWKNWDFVKQRCSEGWKQFTKDLQTGKQNIIDVFTKDIPGAFQYAGDWIVNNLTWLDNQLQSIYDGISQYITMKIDNTIEWMGNKVSEGMQWISDTWNNGWSAVGDFFSGIWEGIKGAASDGVDWIVSKVNGGIGSVNNLIDKVNSLTTITLPDWAGGGSIGLNIPNIPQVGSKKFATGTSFAPGGLSLVGEHGPEYMQVPTGSKVYTNSETKNMMGGKTIVVNNYFNGMMIGEEDFFNRAGDHIWDKVNLAMQR